VTDLLPRYLAFITVPFSLWNFCNESIC
jgi:hypothetical protein